MTPALLITFAGGLALTLAVIVYVTAPPAGNVAIVSSIAALPLGFGHAAPPLPAQVHSRQSAAA